MENFEFWAGTRFFLEEDADLLCGREAKKYGSKVLFVHYGDKFTYESGLHQRILDALKKEGLVVYELANVEPNPKLKLVYQGVDLCKKYGIETVLAVGGGSVIDTAKAVAIGAKYSGDVWDFYQKKDSPKEALPIGVVMTLPATGSEGSNGSVITNAISGENLDVLADCLRPSFVLMNPNLTLTVPLKQSVYGIIDMFSHVMERYFSSSEDTVFTDYLCEGAMKSIIVNAYKLLDDLRSYTVRADLMWTSIIAHNGLLATGRNQDWATHAIGAQISSTYNSVHAATISVLYPNWASYVYKDNLNRFVQFANRVFGVDVDFYDLDKTAKEGIRRMRQFFTDLGGPETLGDLGICQTNKIPEMAKSACRFGNIGGLKSLNRHDVEEILLRSM